jgi:hypothetical protein
MMGKIMSNFFCRFRHMRTTQERRRWFADACDVPLRLARSVRALPSAWDDFWRSPQRSWKEQRKTKYKSDGGGNS